MIFILLDALKIFVLLDALKNEEYRILCAFQFIEGEKLHNIRFYCKKDAGKFGSFAKKYYLCTR